MKKTLLSLALLTACGAAQATELYNGRLSGMSNAGYVTGGYSDGVLLNPSLAASYGEKDDFAFVFNAGALGSDKDDLIDGLDDLMDVVDRLNENFESDTPSPFTQTDADALIEGLENIDSKVVQITFGGSLVVAIPNDFVSMALVAKAHGSASVYPDVNEDDYDTIQTAVNAQTPAAFDPENLLTEGNAQGVVVTEVGIALAKTFAETETSKILVGITPKRVTAETFIYNSTISEYDEDDFDGDEHTEKGSATSMDAGVTYITGKVRYGLTMANVITKDFKTTIEGEKFELSRQTTAAVGYTGDWFTAEAALDLTATEVFGLGESKMFRAGIELRPVSWLQIRGGMQRDTEDTIPDTYSVGLGISPFDVVNIDLAGFTGKNETMGAALQLGLRF